MPPRPEPCSSSSSLGNDSDEGGAPVGKEQAEDGEGEVQSAYSGAGLDGLAALEESLPIRRGISKFYNGKSRSFTFLKEAIGPSGSAKVIAKADNAYSRKRKNLLAYSIMYDQSQITVPETYKNGITKRLAGLSRLRPSDGMSSNSSSSSSLSSDENEPPQQFIFVQSPDNTAQFASPTIPAPRLGSCASKIFAHANEVVFDGESATFAQPLLICLPGKTTGG
ncbi:uncharacterized protein LOC119301558 [Triticum dicoccoides]|uniref:uncharacterized protein LOC119301558 n=1 Tax=Triticum dicoccoides TaxID=85692 RepID=UPI00188E6FE9|nr:uncharacterized protein LOC119301558 [Triticum dicoccoides]